MTRSTPNHVAVRHIPAIIETITPLIRKVDGGCMWVNPSHSDARVAEIVSDKLGITVTKGNMRHIRDDCFGPIVKRGSVDALAELTDRVMELESQVAWLMDTFTATDAAE